MLNYEIDGGVLTVHLQSELDHRSASGLRGELDQMARRGGRVSVKNADGRVDRLFQMSGIYKLVDRMA